MRSLTAGLFGFVFGLGLIVAGMTDPARVLGFLDVATIWAGSWDPSLAFVMIGAIAAAAPAFAIARRKPVALLGDPIALPDRRLIDARLVGGAALFGLGWGLAGICPGPALVLLGNDGLSALLFVASLLAGGWLADVLLPVLQRSRTAPGRISVRRMAPATPDGVGGENPPDYVGETNHPGGKRLACNCISAPGARSRPI